MVAFNAINFSLSTTLVTITNSDMLLPNNYVIIIMYVIFFFYVSLFLTSYELLENVLEFHKTY